MYVITGATGHTGIIISKRLLEAGKKVRIISRDHEKAKELVSMGADLFMGSHSDVELLKRAFNGATAVYAMIPGNMQAESYLEFQMSYISPLAAALEACKVKYVVALSSQGAQHESGNGVVLGLNKMEKMFNAVNGLNTLHLRAGYFMENILPQAGLIKQMGMMGSPVKADIPLNLIATKDIGEYASKRLLALDFSGKNHQDLLGQRNVSYDEVARILGPVIGKPDLKYIQFTYDDFKKAMMENWGATANAADAMNELVKMLNEGKAGFAQRTDANTTATSIEEFAETFKWVYDNS